MKNDNYSGRHAQNSGREPLERERIRVNENFTVNLNEDDLAVGEDYIEASEASESENGGKYDFEMFSSDSEQPEKSRKVPRERKFEPQSEEINSFSNDTAKNTAIKDSEKELKMQKKELKLRKKDKDRNNKRIFRMFWAVSCVVVGLLLGKYLLVGFNDFLAVNRTDGTAVKVELKENQDIDSIADLLKEKGIINSPSYFKLFAKITDSEDSFQQGIYEIPANLDYQAIISFLQSNSNRSDIVTVQFQEGMNLLEIADKLKENKVIDNVDEFLERCNTSDFDEQFTFLKSGAGKDKYYKLEGYLYPDTYDFYINENIDSVLEKMINNYENRVYYNRRRVKGYDKQIAIGKLLRESEYTPDEIMTIASIIQAEALNTDDMYNISSVIHNRLKEGVDSGVATLDCDSTIYYPYRTKADLPSNMSSYVSKYDTYNVIGLPDGPINCPGSDAILAALLPNDTDYLYFCHSAGTEDEPAQAYYASSLWEHEYNLQLAGLSDGE